MSIKSRILLCAILLPLLGFVVLVIQFSSQANQSLLENSERQIRSSVSATLHHFNALASEMARSARGLALSGELLYQQREQMNFATTESQFNSLLLKTFTSFPQAIGGGVWFEPYAFHHDRKLLGPYAFRDTEGIVTFSWELNSEEYNYPGQEWYKLAIPTDWPRERRRPANIYWTAPYLDQAATEELMMTVDSLMYAPNGHIIGMATVDWSLKDIRHYLSELKPTENSQTFLIHPDKPASLLKNELSQSISNNQRLASTKWQQEFSRLQGQEAITFRSNGAQQEHIYAGKTSTGLIFGVVVPNADLEKIIEQQTHKSLTIGVGVALLFIAIMALLLEILFRPFDHILSLLRSTVDSNHKNDQIAIRPIHYNASNEFTPIVDTFNALIQQVDSFTSKLSETNSELLHSQSEIAELNTSLEEKVELRTQELRAKKEEAINSLQQLKLTQSQLVNMEKYAALGELIAGLTHEVNTPLGISVTAVSALEEQLNDLTRSFRNGTLGKAEFNDFVEFAQEGIQISTTNLRRAADMIASFKQVAVDQASERQRDFEIGDYLNSVVTSLRPKFKYRPITITVNCPEKVFVSSYPGALSQVFTNLIMNSLIHAYEEKQSGEISIDIHHIDNSEIVEVQYRDDGKGMSAEVLTHLFEPFFTTRRGDGGSGMGAHIVYDLVTERLGGELEVTSSPGEGSLFVIRIPQQLPAPTFNET